MQISPTFGAVVHQDKHYVIDLIQILISILLFNCVIVERG
jgi:hypothetical protein